MRLGSQMYQFSMRIGSTRYDNRLHFGIGKRHLGRHRFRGNALCQVVRRSFIDIDHVLETTSVAGLKIVSVYPANPAGPKERKPNHEEKSRRTSVHSYANRSR